MKTPFTAYGKAKTAFPHPANRVSTVP